MEGAIVLDVGWVKQRVTQRLNECWVPRCCTQPTNVENNLECKGRSQGANDDRAAAIGLHWIK
jgi:hypothetical protein